MAKGMNRMNRYFVGKGERLVEVCTGKKVRHREVPFSVRLSIWCGNRLLSDVSDFILCIDKKAVYVVTSTRIRAGKRVLIDFYMPPDNISLGEFEGEVSRLRVNSTNYPDGIHVRFTNASEERIRRLGEILEQKRHLVDLVV
jgi:hypothetical protein